MSTQPTGPLMQAALSARSEAETGNSIAFAAMVTNIVKRVWLQGYDRGRLGPESRHGNYAAVVPAAAAEILALATPADPTLANNTETDFDEAEWRAALERLRHTEPGTDDQGIAIVGVRDLEMALLRLQQFADVALGNAIEVSRLVASPAGAGVGEPMAWVSPHQLAAHTDPTDSCRSGVYLPVRKTRGGQFTQPLFAAFHPAPPTAEEAALKWLGENKNVELSFDYGDADEDGKGWCVHRVNGGVNDREWNLIGCGPTPAAALVAARNGRAA